MDDASLMLMLAAHGLDFVAVSAAGQTAGAVAFGFTSDQVGAFCVILAENGPSVTPSVVVGSGWTTDDPGDYLVDGSAHWLRRLFSKVLVAGDVTSGVTIGNLSGGATDAGAVCYIVRGPTSLAVRSNTDSGAAATTLTVPGLTPAANSQGAVAFVVDRDTVATFTPPTAGAITRLAAQVVGGFAYGVYDWPPGDLTGANLGFSGFNATFRQNGILVELLK